jgi:hypothetical protein
MRHPYIHIFGCWLQIVAFKWLSDTSLCSIVLLLDMRVLLEVRIQETYLCYILIFSLQI